MAVIGKNPRLGVSGGDVGAVRGQPHGVFKGVGGVLVSADSHQRTAKQQPTLEISGIAFEPLRQARYQLLHLWRGRSSVRYRRHIAFGKRQVWHGWGTKQCVEDNGADWDYDCKYGTGRFGPSRRLALRYGVVGRNHQEATLDLEPRCLGFGLIQ